jgi:modulator of FtsH protease HflK
MSSAPSNVPETGAAALTEALDISFRLLRWALVGLFVVYLLSGLFVVRQHERAFVLIFGRTRGVGEERVRQPGAHWTLPRPFAEIRRVETERVRVVLTAIPPPPLEPGAPAPEVAWDEYQLTGDANLVRGFWALRYTVGDPAAWLFNYENPDVVLRNELAHAVIRTTARFRVEAALRTDVESVRAAVEETVRRRAAAIGLGARIERVDLVAMGPPPPVAEAFDRVIQSEQDRSRQIGEARAYAARVANETVGDAARILSEAEAYQRRLVAEVSAEADYFRAVQPRYAEQPDVVAQTLHQEALRRALRRVGGLYYLRPAPSGRQELRLWLGPRQDAAGRAARNSEERR